jgi:DNA-binding transcriptional ArsR family regulator
MTNLDDSFAALADPTRRRIFEKISRRPSAVRDLARAMPVSRPAVSQHLKVLAVAGLVEAEARGTRRIYRLNLKGVAAMRRYFDQFWDDALLQFKLTAEQPEDRHGPRTRP